MDTPGSEDPEEVDAGDIADAENSGSGAAAEPAAETEKSMEEMCEEIDGELNASNGRTEGQYELYAVIHHLGAMSAGHYVAR